MNAEFVKNLLFLVGCGLMFYMSAVVVYRVVAFVAAAFFGTRVTVVVSGPEGKRRTIRLNVPKGDDLLEAIERAERSNGR